MLGPKRKLGHAGAAPVDLAVEAEAPAAPTPTTAALREPIYVTEVRLCISAVSRTSSLSHAAAPLRRRHQMDQHHHAAVSRTMASWVATRAGGVLVNLDSQCVAVECNDGRLSSSSCLPQACAHPARSDDLGCPPRCKLPAVATGALLASGDPAALAAFDIGTWILPLVAHGGVSSVLWVTAWGRVPACEFDAVVLLEHDGSLRVTGTAVPPVWRALWSGDYVEPPPRGPGGAGVALDLGSPQPAGLLGERLRVRFSDRFWYGGAVAGYDPKRDSYTVAFDDGGAQQRSEL